MWPNESVCSSHVFSSFIKITPDCFTAAGGGKHDRQIYRLHLIFNLRQPHCSPQRIIKIPVVLVDKMRFYMLMYECVFMLIEFVA